MCKILRRRPIYADPGVRNCRISQNQKHQYKRQRMASNFLRSCNLSRAIGVVNMEVPCFFFPDLLSRFTLRTCPCRSRRIGVRCSLSVNPSNFFGIFNNCFRMIHFAQTSQEDIRVLRAFQDMLRHKPAQPSNTDQSFSGPVIILFLSRYCPCSRSPISRAVPRINWRLVWALGAQ